MLQFDDDIENTDDVLLNFLSDVSVQIFDRE